MWAVIHMFMEATQGISLYSYFYLKLAKNTMFFLLSFMGVFFGGHGEGGGGGGANDVHTCK
jgi:hypothetical protein